MARQLAPMSARTPDITCLSSVEDDDSSLKKSKHHKMESEEGGRPSKKPKYDESDLPQVKSQESDINKNRREPKISKPYSEASSSSDKKHLSKHVPKLPIKKNVPVAELSAFQKLTVEELETIKLEDLFNIFKEPVMPSKSYEEKFSTIQNEAERDRYLKWEETYFKLYKKGYAKMTKVLTHLKEFFNELNKSKNDEALQKHYEQKIRTYIRQCFDDPIYHQQRMNVANWITAVELIRKRSADFDESHPI